VLISAPSRTLADCDAVLVPGINLDTFDPSSHRMVLVVGAPELVDLQWNPGYASRRRRTKKVMPIRTAASTTKMPVSMPWKAQNLLAGWKVTEAR
jgi:hypothetical protein